MTKTKFNNYRNIFLTFLLIANSGFPFFTNDPWILVCSLFVTAFFIRRYYTKAHSFFFITLLGLTALVLGQTLVFSEFSLKTTISLYVRWIYPFLFLYVIKDKFFENFVKVLYWLTIFSLILHFTLILIPSFQNVLNYLSQYFQQTAKGDFYSYNPNILIFTIRPHYIVEGVDIFRRNSGPFWEPGAFGIYLVLAFIINFYLTKNIWNKKNLVFLLAILTTWSTGTFVSIFFFIGLYGIFIIRKKIYTLLIIPILLLAISQSYNKLSFFSDRIDRSILYFKERDQVSNMKRDRMISAIVDIQDLLKSPIFGYGRNRLARFSETSFGIMQHRNNGTTDFLVKYGIIFSLYYFMLIRRSFFYFYDSKKKSKMFANIVIATILVLGFYEVIFQMPVFITLYYFSVFYIRKEQYANTNYLSQ